NQRTGLDLQETSDHFQAQSTIDNIVAASGAVRTVAVSLLKIANDIRWMGSGPRAGIGELDVPAVQPGSSIMPGKVNPVIAESLAKEAFATARSIRDLARERTALSEADLNRILDPAAMVEPGRTFASAGG